MILPDYHRCGTNMVASIAQYFGVQPLHHTLPELDALLASGQYRNIVLLVLDGMGMEVLERCLKPDGLLRSRLITPISAVFPSTTTAATTSLISGLNPGEHGWIGWTLHFDQLGKSVDTFSNLAQFTNTPAACFHAAETFLPYQALTDTVNRQGTAKAVTISPYANIRVNSLQQLVTKTVEVLREPGQHYVYTYWGEPDHTMHRLGCHHAEIQHIMNNIEERLIELHQSLSKQDLVLVTADHGLLDAPPDYFEDFPELHAMLRMPPAVEPRAAALYVQEKALSVFPAAFKQAFGKRYWLMTGDEAVSSGLFGPDDMNPLLRSLVGDYFAVAVSNHALFDRREHCNVIGVHAGLTEQEMRVPLIAMSGDV